MWQFLPQLIGLGASWLGSKLGGGNDSQLTPEQQAVNARQSALADQLNRLAGDRAAIAGPAYARGINYYTSLLNGNPAASLQAVSPDIRRITDQAHGTQSAIDMRLRGPARDAATAELLRNRQADIAQLTGAPRQQAAAALLGAGSQGISEAGQLYGNVGSIYGNQAGTAGNAALLQEERNKANSTMWSDAGGSIAKLLAPYALNPSAAGKPAGAPSGGNVSTGYGSLLPNNRPVNFGYNPFGAAKKPTTMMSLVPR